MTALNNISTEKVDEWIRSEHHNQHCDDTGKIVKPVTLDYLQPKLDTLTPDTRSLVWTAIDRYRATALSSGRNSLILNRLNDELARKPLSEKDASHIYALAQLECSKHTWTIEDREQTQELVFLLLANKRPDIHARHIREAVERWVH
jgi:hypothetical protein